MICVWPPLCSFYSPVPSLTLEMCSQIQSFCASFLHRTCILSAFITPATKCVNASARLVAAVKWSECLCANTAAPWRLILGKSGLRKNQSCCWLSLFAVSTAPGHETHRIYAEDKEGGFHDAWWSASDLYLNVTPVSECGGKG